MLVGATSGGMLGAGYCQLSVAFILMLLTDMSTKTQGFVASALNFGAVLGQPVFGILADAFDAKTASIVIAAMSMFGCILSGSAGLLGLDRDTALILGRLICGVGFGAEGPVAAVLAKTADHSSVNEQQLLIYNQQATQIGAFLCPIVFLLMMYLDMPSEYVWRLELSFCALPVLMATMLRLGVGFKSDATDATHKGSANLSYREKIRRAMESGKMTTFCFQCCTWSLSFMVVSCAASYSYVLFQDMVPAASTVRGQGIQFGAFTAGQLCLNIAGGMSVKCFSQGSLTWVQSTAMFFAAMCLLGGALISGPSMLLVGFCGFSFWNGIISVTVYTIAAEMLPVASAGTFMGAATTLTLLCSAFATMGFSQLLAAVGIERCYYLGALLLAVSAAITRLLVGPQLEDTDKEKVPLMSTP